MTYSDIVLPNMGFGMEEGQLLAWLKKPGDPVRKGESVAEVESDKATVELEALVDGVLDTILVPPNQLVPVGTVLARIRSADESASVPLSSVAVPSSESTSDERSQRISPIAQRVAREQGVDLSDMQGSGTNGRITQEDVQAFIKRSTSKPLAAPAVRKLARDNGLDLSTVIGTGQFGHIRREDVEALLTTPLVPTAEPVSSPPFAIVRQIEKVEGRHETPISHMRQTIAKRLSQSANEAPHFYTTAELDFTDVIAALPQGIGVNTLIVYLTVKTLLNQPELNATYENGHLYHYDHVNLAVAVAIKDGLMTPVLRRADDYSLSGLAGLSRDLIERTRLGKLKPDELAGGTFTISNLGIVKQIDRFTAIINPPQVAILAVGAAKPRPVVINGGLHIRTTAHLTLSADHRIIDGMVAARFLEAFDAELHQFERTLQ
ncbi:MAG: dihydrolipoamide acetyltransferase family protein [Chloroflexota bacterium]